MHDKINFDLGYFRKFGLILVIFGTLVTCMGRTSEGVEVFSCYQ
jgi:hypothetical protein